MRLIFNIGWALERSMYIVKNRMEDEDPPPRRASDYIPLYYAWKATYKKNREDVGYGIYNQTHNPHIVLYKHSGNPHIHADYRKILIQGRNRTTSRGKKIKIKHKDKA